ncbi:MAG: oligogalacturonate lyase family protein [Prolixibacteraceae bacterium]
MKIPMLLAGFFLVLQSCVHEEIPVLETGSVQPMPEVWIDKDTGHKIKHMVKREGDNRSFYFHNNPFLSENKDAHPQMIFTGSNERKRNLFSVDLLNGEVKQITNKNRLSGEIVGRKKRNVYYQCSDSVFMTNVETLETRLIYVFPDSVKGSITSVNADETLLGGAISSNQERELFRKNPEKRDYFNLIYEARLERSLFTISINDGTLNRFYSEKAWLNHVQFSPLDPNLLMYCHEGPWHKVNRIWTIDVTKGEPKLMHQRTVEREIAGHEFFSPDGKRVWFDLQIPRSETFYLSSINIKTDEVLRYGLTRNEWSIHFNTNSDQTQFAGDGGDSGQVAKAKDGRWIYLFNPDGDSLRSEKLVNMKHHDYDLEPNVHFSPDDKWIIFRANFEGFTDIYAVEIKKKK